ncbi:MAG: 4-hydroxy-tetrahydrodipicolinate reductase [Devosia nanyangense]|uniref:4-hydroxy-tetrahydrodipicolinate reductase n=1 Tax=Devosia nanyangense TaxID=1228055 RepID=A0A933NZ72_9HYPH|nr:4-hydroxy-tetrahydrodipicolinate reductase [Devosia nanyangense]
MTDLKVAIAGAGGRMGAANIRAVTATPGLVVHSAFDRPGSPAIGRDAGEVAGIERLGVVIVDDAEAALAGAEAIIDFTVPAVSVLLAERAASLGLVHIIGTTGCSRDEDWAIQKAGSAGARIVKTGNFSLGVNMLAGLVRQVARALPGYDVEILEMHHNKKVDAPSGTALMLGQAAAAGRGVDFDASAVRGRDGHTGPRVPGTIGFAALRGGNVIGDHTVIFAGETERIEITHRAESRAMFAAGAMQAALWAKDQPAGFYDMADVLGVKEQD